MSCDNTESVSVAVVAICKNEEANLPGFLSCFTPWVDEVIVVDDGSTDRSCDILRESGKAVTLVEKKMTVDDGFAGLRNAGLAKATADWVIHTDIDERVTPAFVAEVRSLVRDAKLNGIRYRRKNFFLNTPMRGSGLQDWNKPQLARRGAHRFEGAVHETCVIEGGSASTGQMEQPIWHLNEPSYLDRIYKSASYCQEQARRLASRNLQVRWWHFLAIPAAEFVRKYVLRGGYRDGIPGLIFCLHASTAMFKACALVWDTQNTPSRAGLEQRIQDQWRTARESDTPQ